MKENNKETMKENNKETMKENNKIILKENIKEKLKNGFLNDKYLWKKEFENINEQISVSIDTITKEQLMFLLLHTANMPTKNNSEKTANSAADLAKTIGSYHMLAPIQKGFEGFVQDNKSTIESSNENNDKGIVTNFGYNNYNKNGGDLITAIPDSEDNNYFSWEKSNNMFSPKYKSDQGDWKENLAIQNVQARLRMLTAYYMSQLLPLYRWNKRNNINTIEITNNLEKIKSDRPNNTSFLLVLGSSNADEALRGFYTKYDAASADINPIGSLSKTHLREFLKWCGKKWIQLKDTMDKILDTVASPELTPAAANGSIQDDEIEIEMTYNQLYILGKLRKEEMLGPVSMFKRLCEMWLGKTVDLCVKPPDIGELYKDAKDFVVDGKKIPAPFTKIVEAPATATIIANIVTIFFDFYGIHRNKMTILTPSVHGTGYSPDDNRYDQRPFLYPKFRGSETHKIIVKLAEDMDQEKQQTGGSRYPKLTRRYKYKNKKYTRNKKH